jgi:hypothetical protein
MPHIIIIINDGPLRDIAFPGIKSILINNIAGFQRAKILQDDVRNGKCVQAISSGFTPIIEG